MTTHPLSEIITGLRYCANEKQAAPIWERARKLMLQAGVDPARVEEIVVNRNTAALAELAAGGTVTAPSTAIDAATLKRALKTFRKHLQLLQLDEESHIGAGPMSKGRHSGIVATAPPPGFPPEVWGELVRQGRLRDAGHGQYQLVEG